jgi:hypothetical protein
MLWEIRRRVEGHESATYGDGRVLWLVTPLPAGWVIATLQTKVGHHTHGSMKRWDHGFFFFFFFLEAWLGLGDGLHKTGPES